ncbi:MAG TPA: purine-binding chemotaxis protein CheW [bacterium]|nr:purine-binding chemotaxis protein CheW [bacterium]
MSDIEQFVFFQLNAQIFALPLSNVQRIARSVEITPLPQAPDIVIGVINVRGQIVPVVDFRKRLNLPPREISLKDHLIIGKTDRRSVALLVDDVTEISRINDDQITQRESILSEMPLVKGAVKVKGEIILIHDLEKFLSLDEEKKLNAALKENVSERKPKRKTARKPEKK